MKKTLFFALIVVVSMQVLHAQPVLTAPGYNPLPGDVFVGHVLDTVGVTPGASGAGATWNFAAVTETGTDTTTYSTCAVTPYCDSFSTSNLAYFDGTDYYYCRTSTSVFTVVGAFVSGTGYVHLTNPDDQMVYPFTYQSMYRDTTITTNSGLNVLVTDSSYVDAYGTLILPWGTFSNVLRVHTITVFTESLGSIVVNAYRSETYIWYKPGFHNALMEVDIDTTGAAGPYISGAEYYKGPFNTTGLQSLNPGQSGLVVYPNPANDAMHISFDAADPAATSVTVADMTGRTIATMGSDRIVKGKNDLTFPATELPAGIYIVQLHTEAGLVSKKVVVNK